MRKNKILELMTKCTIIIIVFICVLLSCHKQAIDQNEEARKAMITLMNSYIDAIKELNAEKIISCYSSSPEFMFYADGKRQNYDELVNDVRDLFANIKKYEGKWDTIYTCILNPNTVAALASFQEVLTDKNDVETSLKGEVTWIAIRVEKKWKFIYAHATYQPDTIK